MFRTLLLALIVLLLAGCGTLEVAVEDMTSATVTGTASGGEPPTATQTPAEMATSETPAGPSQPANLLPAPVYFISMTDAQIWRVERDGATLTQITSEEAPVTDFDVSPRDGALVYVSDNSLIYTTTALGGRRQVLIPGNDLYNPEDYLSVVTYGISRPLWSPDGSWIVFGEGGINLHLDPAEPPREGVPEVFSVLDNDPLPDPLPEEGTVYKGSQRRYVPLSWLPDGQRVLVEEAYYFALGSLSAVLNIEDGSVVELAELDLPGGPCCYQAWSQDGETLYLAGDQPGMFQTGLWRADPFTGEAVVLVPGERGSDLHLFAFPFEASPAEVYGFYASEPASGGAMPFPPRPMVMVSVANDGSAELRKLRHDYYVVGEAAWLSDEGGAVISDVAGRQGGWPLPGLLRWLPSDGSPAVELPAEGTHLHWGMVPAGLPG